MSSQQTAQDVLDRHFLELRAKLLEIGATLDRIDRADASDLVSQDERLKQIHDGIKILLDDGFNRAGRIQNLFSDEYEPNWNR